MKIAFFISNHGFGHVMRNLPVADELMRLGHEVVIVTGESQARAAGKYLGEGAQFLVCDTDAGLIVKPGTLIIDREASTKRIREHLDLWPDLISRAPEADVYVIDIVPWALLAARKYGIPTFFMASFTWIEQYEPFLQSEFLDRYKGAFACTDKVLYYDLVNQSARRLLGDGEDVGFVCRPFHENEVARIRNLHKRPIVFLSLGGSNVGLDMDIDVSGLPYDFITTQALHLKGPNVEYLDPLVENSQDYVKAADYCIAKAGWSTVSEIMIAGAKAAFLERKDTPEDTMTIAELSRRGDAVSISVEDLSDMAAVLRKIDGCSRSEAEYPNNYRAIAERIICPA